MSFAQEHAAPLPPPPPAPPSSQAPYAHSQHSPLRRIAVHPPILTTQLAPPPGQYSHGHTPASATSLNVSFSPYAPSPSTYAPSPVVPHSPSPMAMRNPGYNPQQWARSGGMVGGQYVPHSVPHSATQTPVTARPQDVTGMEGMSRFRYSSRACTTLLFVNLRLWSRYLESVCRLTVHSVHALPTSTIFPRPDSKPSAQCEPRLVAAYVCRCVRS
jgi:hypothetical protein